LICQWVMQPTQMVLHPKRSPSDLVGGGQAPSYILSLLFSRWLFERGLGEKAEKCSDKCIAASCAIKKFQSINPEENSYGSH